MPYDVKLPDIGEGVAEGEIVRWLVKPGQAVKEDQPLVEVMTDKASVEIPSPRTGTIAAVHAEEGQTIPVGTTIVSIALPGEEPGAGPPPRTDEDVMRWNDEGGSIPAVAAARSGVTSRVGSAGPAAGAGRVQAAPAVRQLAKQLGVALETVSGTGPGGAIVADDVKRASQGGGSSSAAAVAAPSAPARPAPPSVGADEERIPLRGLRRKIAEHMRHSLATAAPFTFVAECDFTALVEHRAALKSRADAAGVKLTYLSYVVLGLIEPLRAHPYLNASLDDARQEIVLHRKIHLGIATATPEGLTVPVLHDADRLTLFAAAREIERLSNAARERKLRLEELQGATFTITSTGSKGGVLATPILHHPQVAILGVHEVKKRPAVVNGEIAIRDLGNLSLTLDHRVVDGAVGAEFLYAVVERLERPASWLPEGGLS